MQQEANILRKWYQTLGFSSQYDAAFEAGLSNSEFSLGDAFGSNPYENFFIALYRCEKLEQQYAQREIPRQILLDTLSDLVVWTDVHYGLTGKLGLAEPSWLENHLAFGLFKLGRLQFRWFPCRRPFAGFPAGTPVLEIHIQAGGGLSPEACEASIAQARHFYATYFPELEYRCFTCHSWLMAPSLAEFLPPDSNILKFQAMFRIDRVSPSDAALKYIFRWDTDRNNLPQVTAPGRLAERVRQHVLAGGELHEGLGWFL